MIFDAVTLEALRGIGTLLALCAFIGICLWAYSGKRKADFDAAALLPFIDDEERPFADDNEPSRTHEENRQ